MHNKYIITYECHDNAPRMWKVVQLEKYIDFSLYSHHFSLLSLTSVFSWLCFEKYWSLMKVRNQPTLRRMKIYYYWTNVRKWIPYYSRGIEGEKRTHPRFSDCACTKSGSLRFSQFSGWWLILSVYILLHSSKGPGNYAQ
jgi:hypothetical protein